jgi:hypothetical protein
MMHLKHEKKITWFVVITFLAQPVLMLIAYLIYPPDFSKEFPVYDPDSIMIGTYGNATEKIQNKME